MSKKKSDIEFLKFLHQIEKIESQGGLFTTDTVMTIVEIRAKFLSLNKQVKFSKRMVRK